MNDLTDRVALVTGGSRGIGAAVAIALAKAGADVAVNYRERADAAQAVCGEINETGRKAIAVQADVSVGGDVKRMVSDIEAKLGGIDIVVNNAAIAHPRKLEEITEAEVGAHHQLVISRRTNRRGSGSALCFVQGRNHRTNPLLRFVARSRRNHRE